MNIECHCLNYKCENASENVTKYCCHRGTDVVEKKGVCFVASVKLSCV